MSKFKLIERPIPDDHKFCVRSEFFRKFSFRERMQILLGWRAKLRFAVFTPHNPGRHHPTAELVLTKELDPVVSPELKL